MKQYRYNSNNINKNYIASYANILLGDNQLLFINTLTDRKVVLCGENDSLACLLTALENGVSDQELCKLLSKYHVENLLETLLLEGMIE